MNSSCENADMNALVSSHESERVAKCSTCTFFTLRIISVDASARLLLNQERIYENNYSIFRRGPPGGRASYPYIAMNFFHPTHPRTHMHIRLTLLTQIVIFWERILSTFASFISRHRSAAARAGALENAALRRQLEEALEEVPPSSGGDIGESA